jgi:hypothetical protein
MLFLNPGQDEKNQFLKCAIVSCQFNRSNKLR